MVSKEIDDKLKLLCLEIAARELIDFGGRIKVDELFSRAKAIYNAAYYNKMFEWGRDHQEPAQDPEDIPEGMKVCPGCREVIPVGWKKHVATSKGAKCGYTFQDA